MDNRDGGPHMSCIELADPPPPVSTGSVSIAGRTRKEVDKTTALRASTSPLHRAVALAI